MEIKADTKSGKENSTETERDKETNIARKRIRKILHREEANRFHSKNSWFNIHVSNLLYLQKTSFETLFKSFTSYATSLR